MKKLLALSSLVCMTLGSIQSAAFADDWFDKYDRHHSGKWNYGQYRSAERHWFKDHPDEHAWKEAEMRARFRELDTDHDGYLHREDLREWHHH